MYTLGTSEGTQANRVKKYLEVKYMDLDYTAEPDGEGFVMFRFPTLDEEEFRNMVFLLKRTRWRNTNGSRHPTNRKEYYETNKFN